jgi:hypothetical protein
MKNRLAKMLASSELIGAGFREGNLEWLALSIRREGAPLDLDSLIYVNLKGEVIKGQITPEMARLASLERSKRRSLETAERWSIS